MLARPTMELLLASEELGLFRAVRASTLAQPRQRRTPEEDMQILSSRWLLEARFEGGGYLIDPGVHTSHRRSSAEKDGSSNLISEAIGPRNSRVSRKTHEFTASVLAVWAKFRPRRASRLQSVHRSEPSLLDVDVAAMTTALRGGLGQDQEGRERPSQTCPLY